MSMLAEPRRKQKLSVDPRNSAWSKDDSKYGQKMLERMGWSKGKGLGRTEQGSTDHIRVKVKNNHMGLGTAASHEDNWIAHQDDFNQLLADLNNFHGQNVTGGEKKEAQPDDQQGFSLEEKSKTSKKRVHYMKFTKGKDLSNRSETDLNCIFGKRGKRSKDQKEENNSGGSPGDIQVKEETPDPDVESITKTVTSSLSMQEYFAQRMARLKRGRGGGEAPGPSSSSSLEAQGPTSSPSQEAQSGDTPSPSEEPDAVDSSVTTPTEEPKKKKKKKKKNREDADEGAVVMEECGAPVVMEQVPVPSEEEKKIKRRPESEEGVVDGDSSVTSGLEQNCEEEPVPSKKKKKSKKHCVETDVVNGHDPSENDTVEPEVVNEKKKKKKHREPVEELEEEVIEEKKSKKDKKKKKRGLE